jgi:hypothetical protein
LRRALVFQIFMPISTHGVPSLGGDKTDRWSNVIQIWVAANEITSRAPGSGLYHNQFVSVYHNSAALRRANPPFSTGDSRKGFSIGSPQSQHSHQAPRRRAGRGSTHVALAKLFKIVFESPHDDWQTLLLNILIRGGLSHLRTQTNRAISRCANR